MIDQITDADRKLGEKDTELETHLQNLQTAIAKHALHDVEMNNLTAEITRLEKALADAEKALQDHLAAHQPPADAPPTDDSALRHAHADNQKLRDHLARYKKRLQAQQNQIDSLQKQIRDMTAALQKTVEDNSRGFKALRKQISDRVQTHITSAKLIEMIQTSPTAFRDAVRGTKTPKQKQYSPEALFLILESMGGTWCMYMDNEGKQIDEHFTADDYKKRKAVLVEQVMYDITMWDSIQNSPKRTRYTSKYVQDFIKYFGLENDDTTSRQANESSDDEDPPDAPPAPQVPQMQEEAPSDDEQPAFTNTYTAPELDAGAADPHP